MISSQALIWLSEQQQKLDAYILKNLDVQTDQLYINKKIIAFFVELGEYANEERSFKFWSKKKASDLTIQLDEYIDGLHFLISLGNDLNFNFKDFKFKQFDVKTNLESYFVILDKLNAFSQIQDANNYQKLLNAFLTIAQINDYSETAVIDAYKIKNKVNFERQDSNY
ncbi:dUTP diphosphatase [Williamsoniiplasma luminosum]|uniref:dUTP diphosphatase n=1 Tax=Williamsoniiplasma luminosum TaxID=214888 RepID=A0A2K8NTF1_9MOLU|nr:dUTP diphosphatase [Williamsoniiplasma luminosum]ATZ17122.1 dUTP diphosphatase [Williamsoniiplasma luminosum]